MHRRFYKILSQNPKYVEICCFDLNNPAHFACHK